MKSQAVTTSYVNVNATPFVAGREATVINMTAAAIVFSTADDAAGTGVATTSIPTLGIVDVPLKAYVKGASAGLYMLGGV